MGKLYFSQCSRILNMYKIEELTRGFDALRLGVEDLEE